MAQPKVKLMNLSNELIERILESVLIAEGPIELAPLTVGLGSGRSGEVGFKKGDPRASYYTDKIHPTLSVLRTSKILHDLGARLFYSHNAFRFSNEYGHYVFACFHHLIGPTNVDHLRDVTIACPLRASYVRAEGADSMYEQVLSPLNMTSRADFSNAFRLEDSEGADFTLLTTVQSTLDILHHLRNLKSLSFLFYQTRHQSSSTWADIDLAMATKLIDLESVLEDADWTRPDVTSAQRKFVNLYFDVEAPLKLRDGDWRPPWGVGVWFTEKLQAHCETIRQAGFEMVDMAFAEYDAAAVRKS